MKTIKFELSTDSIDKAIKELETYRNSLERKNKIFLERIAKLGIEVVSEIMESVPQNHEEEYWQPGFIIDGNELTIFLEGEQVLFIEFSAGITYGISGSEYPTEAGAEMGMGTYPGQGHWDDPNGWWYKDENASARMGKNVWIHTYGNRAYMPMYHAEEAIIIDVVNIAREVFGGS